MKPLRILPVLALAAALVLPMGVPLCFSEACPMSAAEREVCKAMGRDCCQDQGGQLSRSPNVPPAALASIPMAPTVVVPPESDISLEFSRLATAPALVQGVGLFTLFAVFLL